MKTRTTGKQVPKSCLIHSQKRQVTVGQFPPLWFLMIQSLGSTAGIVQSSSKRNFNQLQSCSKQLQKLNHLPQKGVRNRLGSQNLCETCCVLKDLPSISPFSEITYVHVSKTSFLLCVHPLNFFCLSLWKCPNPTCSC